MAEYLVASGSRKISALASVSELSGSTSMPIVMGGSTVQISHSNFLTNNLLTKSNTFSGNNIFSGQTTIQTGSVTGNLPVSGRVTATSFTGSLSFNNLTDRPSLVSGSSQIISVLPSGTVSGSSQVISLLPNGTVSGSSQLTSSYDARYALSGSIANVNTASLVSRLNAIENKTGSYATTGSNTFTDSQTIVGNVTFPSSSFISTTNASGGLYLSALNQGTLQLNADGGEGDVIIGRSGWEGSLKVNGDTTITGSLGIREGNINLSGSIYLDTAIWNYVVETYTSIPVTYGATELTFTVLPDNTITDMSVAVGAGGYGPNSFNLTIAGTTFPGGTSPANDIVFNVQTFETAGPVYSTDVSSSVYFVSGTLPSRYDNISSTGTFGIGADDKHWTFDTSGTFNTPGDINVTGSVSVTETISTQILLTPHVLTGQLIVPTGFNGMLTGPVSNGGELTIENGSNLVII